MFRALGLLDSLSQVSRQLLDFALKRTFEYHEGGGQKLWDPIPQNLSGWSYLATSLGAFCGEMLLRPDLGYGPLLSASHPPAIRQPPENVSKTNQIE